MFYLNSIDFFNYVPCSLGEKKTYTSLTIEICSKILINIPINIRIENKYVFPPPQTFPQKSSNILNALKCLEFSHKEKWRRKREWFQEKIAQESRRLSPKIFVSFDLVIIVLFCI